MSRSLARYIGYPLRDKIKGTHITKDLRFLDRSQYWDQEKLKEYRTAKFVKLIDHAYLYVPYYKNLFDSLGLKPKDFKQLEDLQKLPVLTKEVLREKNDEFLSGNINTKQVKTGKTGGTSGTPIITWNDAADRSMGWASYFRWYKWMGLDMYDRVATLWGAKTVLKSSGLGSIKEAIINHMENKMVINSFDLNHNTFPEVIKKLEYFQPKLLKGYLSSLLSIAAYIEEQGINPKFDLSALSSTTETLTPFYREYVEQVFKTRIFDQYGCGEVGAISYECNKHSGLHITQEHVILEILDANDQAIVDIPGRVVVTNLDNLAMPLIRYENEDTATLSSESCTCGIKHPLMRSIEGRTADTIILENGSKVHGVFFTDILHELGIRATRVTRFQIRQSVAGEIEFLLEDKGKLNPAELKSIQDACNRFFSKTEIKSLDKIELEANGKFLYVKSFVGNEK